MRLRSIAGNLPVTHIQSPDDFASKETFNDDEITNSSQSAIQPVTWAMGFYYASLRENVAS